jgi:replicative DNA helicase
MGVDEIVSRIFAAECKIPMHHLEYDRMTEDDWSRLAKHYGDIAGAPIHIDDTENLTISEICAQTRALTHRHPLRLLVVDYLQLVGSNGRNATREREVTEVVVGLKNLAKELQIHVIALAQLNRDVEKRTDKRPIAADMRESGSLEATADIVILLHREDMHVEDSPRAGEADLIVAKHRGGPKATITVAFQGHYSRFVDMAVAHPRGPWTPHDAAP